MPASGRSAGGGHAACSIISGVGGGPVARVAALGAHPRADRARLDPARRRRCRRARAPRRRRRTGPSTCRAGSRATSSAPPRSPSSGGRRRAAVDLLRQHGAVGRVVVAAARDGVGEMDALHHVVLGDDVLALEQPRLADADLRRDVDDVAVLEARHVGAHEVDQRIDALAALELGLGQVLDLDAVDSRSCAGSCTRRRRAAASSATRGPRSRR